ncbi:lysophospholipid acyltransferase family protein [uncultured Psychrobacillus sp.]|uniref:lysophospholipid acyltransferase family protein n=1 Tax=uncultured Psychrobacillus sp. TaxID=1551585 RepID=UPI0026225925|nr:lysophospholipid acyltransferase family protein [uncultured Psychrobacillus sp.]
MNKLFSSLRTFGFLFGYLPISIPKLNKIKSKKGLLSVEQYDLLVHEVPQKWASGVLKRTKSEFTVEGLENLPEGSVLFVSNHEGNFDIPTLLTHIPKPFGFISKIEIKKVPLVAKWMEEMNCVFLDRTNRKSSYRSIQDTVSHLQNGHSILMFPEGTRSKGQGIGAFKSGFVRIAKDADVPIVPIAIHGTSNIMEKNNNKISPAHVQISILPSYSKETIQVSNSEQIKEDLHIIIANKINELQSRHK